MTFHALPRAEGAVRLPLRLNDLVRNVDREPRIPDLTLADRLGFAKPHNVRKLIVRNQDELRLHGTLVERSANFLRDGEKPAGRGRPGTMYFLNEGQALVLCALARTPIAVRVRQDVIAVYMAHRRGEDVIPTSEGERFALRFLTSFGAIFEPGEPVPLHLHGFDVAATRSVFVCPVTPEVVDTLAAFEAEEEDEDERDDDGDLRDVDVQDERHDVTDEGEGEPSLGWPNSFQGKGAVLGYGDNATDEYESTAPERAGAGFVRCASDDHEDGNDAEHVNEDGTYEDLDPDEDGEGEFAGGTVLGADSHSFVVTVNDPDSWVQA